MANLFSGGVGVAALALVLLTAISSVVVLPIGVTMIGMAATIIYIGSHFSIHLKDREEEETMTQQDAYMFPVVGSCMLFGLYLLFKIFDKDMVNLVLSLYFTMIIVYTVSSTLSLFLGAFIPNNTVLIDLAFTVPLAGKVELKITKSDLVALIISGGLAGLWFKTKHFVLNNIFGIALSVKGIESISLGSYKVGAILLTGLFFYDIFWVFGTEVMVTVAKSFDAPIKLLFLRAHATETAKAQFSMLGLGDIVIPGIFIALLLRFDAARAKPESVAGLMSYSFPKPYFLCNMLFYVLGLVATIVVMYAFDHAQPALLYLVPACLGSSVFQGLVRREFKELWAYEEEGEKKEDGKEKAVAEESKKEK